MGFLEDLQEQYAIALEQVEAGKRAQKRLTNLNQLIADFGGEAHTSPPPARREKPSWVPDDIPVADRLFALALQDRAAFYLLADEYQVTHGRGRKITAIVDDLLAVGVADDEIVLPVLPTPSTPSGSRVLCPICQNSYSTRESCRKHQVQKHGYEPPLQCQRGCDERFDTPLGLQRHYQYSHPTHNEESDA